MIDPAALNFSTLPWVPLDATAGFPAQPGIYFAIDSQNQIRYIGRSGNVRGRWKNHHKYKDLEAIGGVKIAYLFVELPELLPEIEMALIEWFDPPLNVVRRTAGTVLYAGGMQASAIAKLREDKSLTQREVAIAVGVTDQTVSNWEKGIHKPRLTPAQMLALCKVLKCSLEELAILTESKPDNKQN